MNIQSINSNVPHFTGIVSIGKTKMLFGRTFIDKPFEAKKIVALPFSKTIWNNKNGDSFSTLSIKAKRILVAPYSKFSDNIRLIANKINLSHNVKVGHTKSIVKTSIGDNSKTIFNESDGSIYLGKKSTSVLNSAKENLILDEQSESYINRAINILMFPFSKSHKNTARLVIQKEGSHADINRGVFITQEAGSYSEENLIISDSIKNDLKTDFINMFPEK